MMMTDDQELDYRNLVNCRVEITSSSSSSSQQVPVSLPQECYQAANIPIPTPYDFALEKSILKKKHEIDGEIKHSGNKEDLSRSLLVKMKSVTKASEDVCISILSSNSYDLKTSVEAYFQTSM
eukprot:CAMPEP_0119005460 /NCGR_PEP_ID=MMETSP1176-20130426/1736_1 /TAXON_ID=265551 /ORGANISM="Synedropsis recta cf, Strain CCMP1620" /LENGTH=122 /DNA_ID=CAMNT_0006957273 /DNA_START=47 /DNA_END=415 /DNA_ORIENTATION=+